MDFEQQPFRSLMEAFRGELGWFRCHEPWSQPLVIIVTIEHYHIESRVTSLIPSVSFLSVFHSFFTAVDRTWLQIAQHRNRDDGSTVVASLLLGDMVGGVASFRPPEIDGHPIIPKLNKFGDTFRCSLISLLPSALTMQLYVANLGDSRAVLCSNGRAVAMSEDHKPNREDERRRIEALGGRVIHYGTWRVEGILAVSRAIGDR